MKKKIGEEGYRWRYRVEKKRCAELLKELRTLKYVLKRTEEAHAKTVEAWYMAERRFDELYAKWRKEIAQAGK